MEEERKIEELQRLIDTHENIVFFGGAGVSTEPPDSDTDEDSGGVRSEDEVSYDVKGT